MNPILIKNHLISDHSFNVRYDIVPHFYNKWHYHPEVELVHIIKGSGNQFIGDNIHRFKSDDMILVGPNLPHLWRSDERSLGKKKDLKVEAIVIHFMPECFGELFFLLPENKALATLLERSKQAVRIKDETKKAVSELIKKLLISKNTERIILLLQILSIIAHSRQTKPVCSKGLIFQYTPSETERLNNIYPYILNNFSRPISLKQIAKVANLSPNSFCRYFKSRIKKTFSKFLIEIRIGNACKLLAETQKSVAGICYESGFNSFSNFNRHFKSITGKTPIAHRKYYQEYIK